MTMFLFFGALAVLCGWLGLTAQREGREGVALFCMFAALICLLTAGQSAQDAMEQKARDRAAEMEAHAND